MQILKNAGDRCLDFLTRIVVAVFFQHSLTTYLVCTLAQLAAVISMAMICLHWFSAPVLVGLTFFFLSAAAIGRWFVNEFASPEVRGILRKSLWIDRAGATIALLFMIYYVV